MRPTLPPRQPFHSRLAAVFAGELVNKATVVAAFVWLARTLDPAVYGEVEWALSLTMVFALASDAGLTTWGAAQVAAQPDRAAIVVARVGWLRLFLALPAYLLILIVARSYGGRAGAALAVYGLVLFLAPLFLQYLFNGLFRSGWAALGQAVRGTTFAAAVVLLVNRNSPPSTVALAEVAGATALAVCNLLVLRTAFDVPVHIGEGHRELRLTLKKSWTIGASEVTWGVHWYAGLILLGYLATTTDAAWHSAGLRLVMALHTGVWLYLYVLLPNLARLVSIDAQGWKRLMEQSLRLTGWIGYAVALTGTLAARTILTTVFGAPFVAAVPVLRVMIWIVPVAWASGHIRYSLIAAEHPRKDYHAALVGGATTIALTFLLVPSLRSVGSAVALLGGTLVNGVAAVGLASGILPRFALLRSVAASSACCLACLWLGLALAPVAGELGSTVLAVAVLAAVALFAERDSAREFLHTWAGWRPEAEKWAR